MTCEERVMSQSEDDERQCSLMPDGQDKQDCFDEAQLARESGLEQCRVEDEEEEETVQLTCEERAAERF